MVTKQHLKLRAELEQHAVTLGHKQHLQQTVGSIVAKQQLKLRRELSSIT